jgi:hypothetical protein
MLCGRDVNDAGTWFLMTDSPSLCCPGECLWWLFPFSVPLPTLSPSLPAPFSAQPELRKTAMINKFGPGIKRIDADSTLKTHGTWRLATIDVHPW